MRRPARRFWQHDDGPELAPLASACEHLLAPDLRRRYDAAAALARLDARYPAQGCCFLRYGAQFAPPPSPTTFKKATEALPSFYLPSFHNCTDSGPSKYSGVISTEYRKEDVR